MGAGQDAHTELVDLGCCLGGRRQSHHTNEKKRERQIPQVINLRKFWATNCCTYFFVVTHLRAFKANINYKSKEPTLEVKKVKYH